MKSLLNPLWLFLVAVIPGIVLLGILYETCDLLRSQLSADSLAVWRLYISAITIILVLQLVHATILVVRRKAISWVYGVVTLLVYIPLLYNYYLDYDQMVPWDIPRWMLAENLTVFAGTFLMPAMGHALAVVVVHVTTARTRAWVNAVGAVMIPVSLYVFFETILPLWQPVSHRYEEHVIAVILISFSVAFLFFVTRLMYIIATRYGGRLRGRIEVRLGIRLLVALVLPLIGLQVSASQSIDLFGDFSSPSFFILAVVNGIVVILPESNKVSTRLVVFLARCVTFSFTFYFFMVFLPWLPLAVVAVVALGAGILMLTPLALMVLHTGILRDDFLFLKERLSPLALTAMMAASVAVIPSVITTGFYFDKQTLHEVLAYVYEPDLSRSIDEPHDEQALGRVLATIKATKERGVRNNTPFLSSIYNAIVLENLTLSDEKIARIEKIFGMEQGEQRPLPVTPVAATAPSPFLKDFVTHSAYDDENEVWTSDVELTLQNSEWANQEYVSTFELPEGCWINDYYLMIGDRKEKGILAERKAATWIYRQITETRQDPGLMTYLDGNRVMLRVFPFAPREARTTGFRILHKEPVKIQIDGRTLYLGKESDEMLTTPITTSDGNTIFFPAASKSRMEPYHRKPYYHFVVDCSGEMTAPGRELADRIRSFQRRQSVPGEARYTLVSTYTSTYTGIKDPQEILHSMRPEGGFFLERAIQEILYAAYFDKDERPIIVVVTDHLEHAILPSSFDDMAIALPETDHFYVLDHDGRLTPHPFVEAPFGVQEHPDDAFDIVAWPNARNPELLFRDDGTPSVRFRAWTPDGGQRPSDEWLRGLALEGRWLVHVFHPQYTHDHWRALVRDSFRDHILTPTTSFLALENDAQKKMLLRKQESVLNGEKFLDAGEETRMSEPGFYLVAILAVIALGMMHRKKVLRNS